MVHESVTKIKKIVVIHARLVVSLQDAWPTTGVFVVLNDFFSSKLLLIPINSNLLMMILLLTLLMMIVGSALNVSCITNARNLDVTQVSTDIICVYFKTNFHILVTLNTPTC